MADVPPVQSENASRWRPLAAIDRRVIGVLIEKAKTTPDAYPMSLNSIVAGCNQKSNRCPVMNLAGDDVETSLERLRGLGAVGLVQGYGRVAKYRHYLYEWLGVDKVELAVMAELLLRGPQTEGELRAHAARMEPIRDLGELRPVLASLKAKGLLLPLTPEGRGYMVTHALYPAEEMERVKAQFAQGGPSEPAAEAERSWPLAGADRGVPAGDALETLRRDLNDLKTQVVQLRAEVAEMRSQIQQTRSEVSGLKADLGQ